MNSETNMFHFVLYRDLYVLLKMKSFDTRIDYLLKAFLFGSTRLIYSSMSLSNSTLFS